MTSTGRTADQSALRPQPEPGVKRRGRLGLNFGGGDKAPVDASTPHD